MIPVLIAAQAVQHLLAPKPSANAPSAAAKPAPGQSRAAEGGGSIASDLGKLTTDALDMLGLGGSSGSTGATGAQAARAYATSGNLLR